MPWTEWWPMHWFGMPFGPMLMLAVLLLIVFLAVRGFGLGAQLAAGSPTKSARDILDERYAKGEIEKPEYDKQTLRRAQPSARDM